MSSFPSSSLLPPPPLPPAVLTAILTHLLPPTFPLPPALIHPSLSQRLQFLPPDPSDIDAHLSPFPPSKSYPTSTFEQQSPEQHQPLSSRLYALTRDHEQTHTQYSHDGEQPVARVPLRNPYEPHRYDGSESENTGALDIWFAYTTPAPILANPNTIASSSTSSAVRPEPRWLFHSVRLPYSPSSSPYATAGAAGDDRLTWYPSPSNIINTPHFSNLQREAGMDSEADPTPQDYWRDFGPSTSDLPEANAQLQLFDPPDVEKSYWAQYDAGGPSQSPSGQQSFNGLQSFQSPFPSSVGAAAVLDPDHTPSTDEYLMPPRTFSPSGGVGEPHRPLEGVMSTPVVQPNGHNGIDNDETVTDVQSGHASSLPANNDHSILRQKLLATISSQLNQAWSLFSRNARESGNDDEFEECALRWLRLGRGVCDDGDGGGGGKNNGHVIRSDSVGDALDIKVLATMRTLSAVYGVLGDQGTMYVNGTVTSTKADTPGTAVAHDGFWRLVEGAIKVNSGRMPGAAPDEDPAIDFSF
jgi:hypothetical protein